MDVGDWLGVAGLVVAIIAIPVAVLATRHWGSRRARLDLLVEATPLLPEHAGVGGDLEVTYGHIPVENPHLVMVTFRNSGPRDLSSETFDGGRPITVKFDQTFYGLTAVLGGVSTVEPPIGSGPERAVVAVEPGLLKRDESWGFSAITTGPVQVAIDAPLIDTDVRNVDPVRGDHPSTSILLTVMGIVSGLPLPRLR